MNSTDEISIAGMTWVAKLENGIVRDDEIHPEDAGLPVHPFEAIIGGTPVENATALRNLLQGEKSAYRDAVLLNTAAALMVADKVTDLRSGAKMAADSIDSGAALQKLTALAKVTNEG